MKVFKIISLPVPFFLLLNDIKSNCVEESDSEETKEAPESVLFTDSYNIATEHFKSMTDSYVSGLTITQEEIEETERTT